MARLLLSLCLCFVAAWAHAAPAAVVSIAPDHSPVQVGETFSLTVTYDTAMDTTINPVISFPTSGEDASPFLTTTTSVWLSGTSFKQNYQAQHVALNVTTVDVAVNGAKDTFGAAQQAGFQANVFDVTFIPAPAVFVISGTLEPDNVLVGPVGSGKRTVTAADVGKTVQLIAFYDIPTDYAGCGTGVLSTPCPQVTFTNTGGTPLSMTNVSTQWQTRTRYKIQWTIADGDEQFDSINIKIAGGVGRRDDTDIKNIDAQFSAVFSIDTKHPTVTGITTGSPAITSTSPANGLVTLTVAYSHAMDTTSTPSLSFPNHALGTALTPTTGAWTDSTHYAQTYRVSGAGISFASVDVRVSGARKLNSNLQREGTVAGAFGINLLAPEPTLASLTPLIVSIPGFSVLPGTVLDASCCGDIFVRVLSRALNTALTLVGHTATGTVVLDGYLGGRLAFLVTAVAAGDVRDEGVYAVGDGQYQVVSGGVAATIVPALVNIGQLASLLPQGSSTIQMTAHGVLTATLDGLTYVVQPGVAVQRLANADGKPGITKGSDGYLHFTDGSGNDQILYPAFLEPQTVRNYLRAIDGGASLAIQLDGTAKVVLQGQAYDLVPDITLSGLPSSLPGQGWLQDAARHFLFLNQQRANTVQGLGLTTQ